jgi:hypothetical protein
MQVLVTIVEKERRRLEAKSLLSSCGSMPKSYIASLNTPYPTLAID